MSNESKIKAKRSQSVGVAFCAGAAVFSISAIASYLAGNTLGWAVLAAASVVCAVLTVMAMRASNKWFALAREEDR